MYLYIRSYTVGPMLPSARKLLFYYFITMYSITIIDHFSQVRGSALTLSSKIVCHLYRQSKIKRGQFLAGPRSVKEEILYGQICAVNPFTPRGSPLTTKII